MKEPYKELSAEDTTQFQLSYVSALSFPKLKLNWNTIFAGVHLNPKWLKMMQRREKYKIHNKTDIKSLQ